MLIRYKGPFPAVDVPEAGLYGVTYNEPVDVDDDVAAGLLDSGVWSAAGGGPFSPHPPAVPATPPPAGEGTPAPTPATAPAVPAAPKPRTTTTRRRSSGQPKE